MAESWLAVMDRTSAIRNRALVDDLIDHLPPRLAACQRSAFDRFRVRPGPTRFLVLVTVIDTYSVILGAPAFRCGAVDEVREVLRAYRHALREGAYRERVAGTNYLLLLDHSAPSALVVGLFQAEGGWAGDELHILGREARA